MADLFISYSRRDSDFVLAICTPRWTPAAPDVWGRLEGHPAGVGLEGGAPRRDRGGGRRCSSSSSRPTRCAPRCAATSSSRPWRTASAWCRSSGGRAQRGGRPAEPRRPQLDLLPRGGRLRRGGRAPRLGRRDRSGLGPRAHAPARQAGPPRWDRADRSGGALLLRGSDLGRAEGARAGWAAGPGARAHVAPAGVRGGSGAAGRRGARAPCSPPPAVALGDLRRARDPRPAQARQGHGPEDRRGARREVQPDELFEPAQLAVGVDQHPVRCRLPAMNPAARPETDCRSFRACSSRERHRPDPRRRRFAVVEDVTGRRIHRRIEDTRRPGRRSVLTVAARVHGDGVGAGIAAIDDEQERLAVGQQARPMEVACRWLGSRSRTTAWNSPPLAAAASMLLPVAAGAKTMVPSRRHTPPGVASSLAEAGTTRCAPAALPSRRHPPQRRGGEIGDLLGRRATRTETARPSRAGERPRHRACRDARDPQLSAARVAPGACRPATASAACGRSS